MPDDPVLLITGASSGIGAATARAAAEAGYRLVLGARSRGQAARARRRARRRRAGARGPSCDVTELADNERLAAAALDGFGRFDAVFANAGFGAKRGFLEGDPEQWRAMVLTNVLGVAYTIRATLPHLLERGEGQIVITSSVAGRRALPGSLYSATKHAVTAIGEALRQELRTMPRQPPHPGDADRARDGRHAVLRPATGPRPRAARRRHRQRGRLRALPARARRRQRDPHPPVEPGDLD